MFTLCMNIWPESSTLLSTCYHYILTGYMLCMNIWPESTTLLSKCYHYTLTGYMLCMNIWPESTTLLSKCYHYTLTGYKLCMNIWPESTTLLSTCYHYILTGYMLCMNIWPESTTLLSKSYHYILTGYKLWSDDFANCLQTSSWLTSSLYDPPFDTSSTTNLCRPAYVAFCLSAATVTVMGRRSALTWWERSHIASPALSVQLSTRRVN